MQADEVLRKIHYRLVSKGFERVATTRDNIYRKDITINNVVFPIGIHIVDPYFVTKPLVLLLRKPDNLTGQLPHLFFKFVLCYLDDTGVEFDQFSPEDNIDIVCDALMNLLDIYANRPEVLQEDIKRELPVYWSPDSGKKAFLLAQKDLALVYQQYKVKKKTDDFEYIEFVLSNDPKEIDYWVKSRKGEKVAQNFPAFTINLTHDISFPDENWPPKSLKETIEWLEGSNQMEQANIFASKIFKSLCENRTTNCFIVFKIDEILFSLLVEFDKKSSLKEMFGRYIGMKNKVIPRYRKNRKKVTGNISFNYSVIKSQLIKAEKKGGASVIKRLSIDDASQQMVSNRNLSNQCSLRNKKIALIGCGTIGGYAANLLTQAGAGCGVGELHLFDLGILEAENLGRHFLGIEFLGEKKVVGVKQQLLNLSGHQLNIQSIERDVCAKEVPLMTQQYDLIVDATGEIGFSTSLCNEMHQVDKPIPVIYTWVDAMGLATRAIYDDCTDGDGCYVCLKEHKSNGGTKERFQLFKNGVEIPEWQPRACGTGAFIPFSSQASVTAAGLAQSMCLGWANGQVNPRFRHVSLDKRVCETKDQNIEPLGNCPCCQSL